MIRVFNSIQLLILFSCMPFILQWTFDRKDWYVALFWPSLILYLCMFVGGLVIMVSHDMWDKKL